MNVILQTRIMLAIGAFSIASSLKTTAPEMMFGIVGIIFIYIAGLIRRNHEVLKQKMKGN